MGKYQDWVAYFENLATINVMVQHSTAQKKFFTMKIEELFSAVRNSMPAADKGPLVIFIKYIRDISSNPSIKENQQLGIVVLQGYGVNDWEGERTADFNSETVLNQFINKMREDSDNGHVLFNHSFDTVKARITPFSVDWNIPYTGWMATFPSISGYNCAVNENDWL